MNHDYTNNEIFLHVPILKYTCVNVDTVPGSGVFLFRHASADLYILRTWADFCRSKQLEGSLTKQVLFQPKSLSSILQSPKPLSDKRKLLQVHSETN